MDYPESFYDVVYSRDTILHIKVCSNTIRLIDQSEGNFQKPKKIPEFFCSRFLKNNQALKLDFFYFNKLLFLQKDFEIFPYVSLVCTETLFK